MFSPAEMFLCYFQSFLIQILQERKYEPYLLKQVRSSHRGYSLYPVQCTEHSCLTTMFNNNIGVVNTTKYLFSPDCSFKICENPANFSESVPKSSWLCRHFVHIVIDYANTVSAYFLMTLSYHSVRVVKENFSTCPSSQRLHRHGVSVVNNKADT